MRASARRGATRASANSATRFTLRSRDPVERLVRDAVLSEKEAQLGCMFLHVAHAVQLQLQEADGLPPRPRVGDALGRSLVRQRGKRGVALAPQRRQIGVQLLLRIG